MSAGSFGCWAMKAGDFVAREFDGTPTGLASAIAHCGSNGVVTIFPGSGAITVPALPAGVMVVQNEGGRQVVYGRGGVVAPPVNAREFASIQAAIDSLGGTAGTVYVPPGTYTPSTTPSFSGITIPQNVAVRGAGPSTALSMVGTPNADAVRITGSYGAITDLQIVGAGSSGSGYGVNIYPTGLLVGARVERVVVTNTPSWGMFVGRDDVSHIAILTRLVDCNVSGNIGTAVGSLYIGNGCTTLNAYDCFFGGNNTTGTYQHAGGEFVPMGNTHMRGVAAIRFHSCMWEPSGASVCVSLQHSNFGVGFYGCYFEPETVGSRPHIFTFSGYTRGFLLDEPFVNSASTAVGLRLLKTSLQGDLREGRIRGGHYQTARTGGGTDDIVLTKATDELAVEGGIWTDPVGESQLRVTLTEGGSQGASQTRFTRLGQAGRYRARMMDTTTRNALTDVMEGDMIYNVTDHVYQYRSNTAWVNM